MVPRQKPKRVLLIVALLLLVSSGVRFATGMGPALAYAEDLMAQQTPVSLDEPSSLNISPLLEALQTREARVTQRETAIDDRMRALAAAEEELTKRLLDVEAAEQSLTAALNLSETANNTDITRLTVVYENMKPADSANLFAEMPPDFAAGFLVQMQPEVAAAIMAGLDPQTAYAISVMIAGRNANAPTQ